MHPGSHRSEALTGPSGKLGVLKGRGIGVRNYWENGSVIGYPPPMNPGSHRSEALTEPSGKPGVLKGRGIGVRNYWENGSVIGYPPPMHPGSHRSEALTEPSGKPGVLKGRGIGVRNSVFRPLEASCTRGIGVRNSPPPGDGRPKLLGKWKRNRLPTHEIPGAYRTEALTEPSGNPAVLQREGEGRPKFGFWPLEASLRQGDRRPKFANPGGTVSEIPKCPKDPRGMGVRNYWENGSVIGYPPHEIPRSVQNGGANRAKRKSGVLKGRGNGVRNSPTPPKPQGERRPKFGFRSLDASPPGGRGVRNSPTAGGTASETSKPTTPQGERRPKFAQIQEERRPKFNSIPWISALQFTT